MAGGKGGIPGDRVNYNKLETNGFVTHPVAGNHPDPYPEDPFREEACSEEKEAHLGVPSCQGAAYCQEALGDDLASIEATSERTRARAYLQKEDHQTEAHHNP